jgi:hypothetical protein
MQIKVGQCAQDESPPFLHSSERGGGGGGSCHSCAVLLLFQGKTVRKNSISNLMHNVYTKRN